MVVWAELPYVWTQSKLQSQIYFCGECKCNLIMFSVNIITICSVNINDIYQLNIQRIFVLEFNIQFYDCCYEFLSYYSTDLD